MTFVLRLAPNTPEWLLLAVAIIVVVATVVLASWGAILEIRYASPYTLVATPAGQKWRRAIVLTLLQTSFFPLIGLAAPILSPAPDQWPAAPLFCGGIWVVVLPIVVLFKRWDLERRLKHYIKMDAVIKRDGGKTVSASPFFRWMKPFMTSEFTRFVKDGFPEDTTR
ncbi:MAG: hypothetical protein CVU38_07105 [Chloroflexi bacterium HGW-Chloroflexi-1]|nr:MAG: hypothetical protein CVU38_07105 [Chloroflexi bacterium HGW-Chloroflexi-1]